MRFPSLVEMLRTAGATARRFPWVLVAAGVAAITSVMLIDADEPEPLLRWLAPATMGLALLTALTIAGERLRPERRPGLLASAVLPAGGILVLAIVYWLWPGWSDQVAGRRYVQLSLCFHLLAAWLAYARPGETNGFWQFNRHLFLRFLVGALYSSVLFLGLAIAILALDQLFGLDVGERVYFRLWMIIVFVFQTWFFLSGVPRDFRALDTDEGYPRGLKVFSQFILTPIVILYLIILTAYMGKIVVTQEWPSGWIGYLVSSVATVGILSLLLVHPIKEREENRWVKTYARSFYVMLLPSVVMLLLAVWKRVDQYGITENRYFLVVISLWLLALSLYFILSRAKSIKVIPVSLCLIALATTFGPWGAYSVSRRSQESRLRSILETNGMLRAATVTPPEGDVSFNDRREMSATLHYLIETHGEGSVMDAFSWPAPEDTTTVGRPRAPLRASAFMRAVELDYVHAHRSTPERFFNLSTQGSAVRVDGYQYAVHADRLPLDARVGDRELRLALTVGGDSLQVSESGRVLLGISLGPLVEQLEARIAAGADVVGSLEDDIVLEASGDEMDARVRIWSVSGELSESGALDIRHVQLDLYARLEP